MAMGLDGNRDAGFLLRHLLHLDGILWTFGKRLALFDEFPDDHVNHFIDLAEGFFPRVARCCGANALQGWAVGVPRRIALGILVRFSDGSFLLPFSEYNGPLCLSWISDLLSLT